MKNTLSFFFIFLFLGQVLKSNAQTNEVKFTLLEGADGFSLGKVNAIVRDRLGFLWLSDQTNRCIIRYDGAHMERFQYDSKNPDGLGGYYPECLTTDSAGNIWIGFYNGEGVDRYDPVTNKFTHFKHDPNNSSSLGNGTVSAILADHLGNLWIGTNEGLDMLNTTTGTFTHYRHIPGDNTSLSHNIVRAIYEDRAGTLWVGTGMAFSNNPEGGLNRFDRKSGTFTTYLHDPNDVTSLLDNAVRTIYEDSKGNFWVGTRSNGLHLMNRATGSFERMLFDSRHPEKLAAPPAKRFNSHITFFTEDAAGNYWIGTEDNGVSRYDVVAKKITHYGNNGEPSGSFTDDSGWWIHASPDGLIWMTTQQSNLWQIDIFNTSIPYVERTKTGYPIFAYFEEPATLWLGTTEGLVKEDLVTHVTQRFQHNPHIKQSLADNTVSAILKDRRGFIWLGTDNGLSRLDPTSGTFLNYLHIPGDSTSLSNNSITGLLEDSDSVLLVTTYAGLEHLNLKTGEFKTLLKQYFWVIFKESNNILWLGSGGNDGITRFNRITGQTKNYLPGLTILNYYIDKQGTIWLAAQNGLYRYDRSSDAFFPAEESNPNLRINAAVYSIVPDLKDNLWMSTSSGLVKFDNKRSLVTVYGKANGIALDWFGPATACIDGDGRLYFIAYRGYYVFDPEKLDRRVSTPTLHFTRLWLEGKIINPGAGPLHLSVNNTKEIQLAYDQNTFDIGFTSVDFQNSRQESINYMLENYDADWRLSNAENRASYFKVPPGDYTFRIKLGQAGDNKEIQRNIHIYIAPPWWKTGWAYAFYSLTFICGVFLIDRVQRRRIRERERALAREKELEQAREIEKAYLELKVTQSQLIQSEKMASLGELTAGIAHEIQNPLNFVNNFSEVSNELIKEIQDIRHKTKDVRDEGLEEELLKDIAQNLEKINHHGKRADAIVKGMLQHSRSSSGVKEPTDINALCDEYLRLAFHGYRAKDKSFNSKFEMDFDSFLPKLNVVPQDIGRVVLNLINNAFYAVNEKAKLQTEGYEPVVSVSTKKEGDKIQISVKDNGKGIPQNIVDKIFQPFFTTKPTGQGTGLGLSLSYDIVKAHGGDINVITEEGIGSEFRIQMPLHT